MDRPGGAGDEIEAIEPITLSAPDPFRPLPPDRNRPRKDPPAALATESPEGLVHTVAPGDTLAGIALRYGISQEALKRANRLWTPHELHSRRTLLIPSATPVSAETREKCTAQFTEVTGCTDASVAQRYLANNGWRVENAVSAYLSRPRTASAAAPPSANALLRLERAEAEAYGDL